MVLERAVTVLLSGRGSNLQALLAYRNREVGSPSSGYSIRAVISNNPDAGGLALARQAGVSSYCVERANYPTAAAHKAATLQATQATNPDLVALAGFMMILPPDFIEAFSGRVINIHPSLLPAFPGLNTHERALESGVPVHGCTVHFVDAGVDTGSPIAQASVPVLATDTPAILQNRVLEQEHRIYPWVVSGITQNNISLEGTRVVYSATARQQAKHLGFRIFE